MKVSFSSAIYAKYCIRQTPSINSNILYSTLFCNLESDMIV